MAFLAAEAGLAGHLFEGGESPRAGGAGGPQERHRGGHRGAAERLDGGRRRGGPGLGGAVDARHQAAGALPGGGAADLLQGSPLGKGPAGAPRGRGGRSPYGLTPSLYTTPDP